MDGKEAPVREMSRTRGTSSREQQQVTAAMLDGSGGGVGIYGSRQQQAPAVNQNLQNVDTGRDGKRGVLSQLIEKVRTINIADTCSSVYLCMYSSEAALTKYPVIYLIFIGLCIVIYLSSTTNKMHLLSQIIYSCKTLYIFQTVFPSIIRSSKLRL